MPCVKSNFECTFVLVSKALDTFNETIITFLMNCHITTNCIKSTSEDVNNAFIACI